MEKIRVNWNEKEGATIVPVDQLQDKSQRNYFVKGLLRGDSVYVSQFDLNIEQGQVERPFKPVFRFTYPIDIKDGGEVDLIVLNFIGARLIKQLSRVGFNSKGAIFLVNDKGYWLKGPNPEVEWSFIFSDKVTHSMGTEYPGEWQSIASSDQGQFLSDQGLFTFSTINPALFKPQYDFNFRDTRPEETWKIISFVPSSNLVPVWWKSVTILLIVGLALIGGLVWYLTHLRIRRVHAIELLEENEKKLTTITGSVLDSIIMVDSSGRAVFWNQAAEKNFGFNATEVLGKDIHDFIAPEEVRPLAHRGLEAFSRTGDGPLIGRFREVEAMRRDGTSFPAELNLNSIQIEGHWWAVGVLRDISERKRTEKDLLESEFRYNLAIEGVSAGIWDWINVNDDAEWWSPKFYKLLGYENDEIEASLSNFEKMLHPDHQAATSAALEAHFTRDEPFIIEYRLQMKNGDYRWFLGSGQVSRDSEGKPARMIGCIIDIHDRKMLEVQARESEAKFRAIYDHVFQFIGLITPDGTLIDANKTALDFTGATLEQIRGLKFWETPWWGDSPEVIEKLKAAILRAATGEFVRYETEAHGTGGHVIAVDFSIKPVFDQGGQVSLLIPEGRDITEKLNFEKALATSELQMRTFVKHTPAAVAMFDREIRYLMASDRWYSDYGLEGRDIIGQRHYDIFPEIDKLLEWKKIHQRCLAGETVSREEDAFTRADGSVDWLKWEVRPWRDSDGEIGGLIMFTEVITARKRAEAQILALNEELEDRVHQRTAELEEAVNSISQRETRAKLLKNVASTANTASTAEEAMETTLSLIAQYTGWPVGHVYIPETRNGVRLIPTGLWYVDDPEYFKEFIEITGKTIFKSGEALPGRIFSLERSHWISDVTVDENFSRAKHLKQISVRGGFGFPVITSRGVEAVLEFFSTEIETPDDSILEMADEVGHQLGYVIDRKRLEKDREESERKFRGIFNQSFQFMGLLSTDGRVLQANETALEAPGLKEEEVVGRFIWEAPWWGHSEEAAREVQKAVETAAKGRAVRFETTNLDKTGGLRVMDFTLKPITDKNGNVLFLIPEGRDITERKRMEAEAKKLALVAEKTDNGVIITNREGEVEWVNDAFFPNHRLRAGRNRREETRRSGSGDGYGARKDPADDHDPEGRARHQWRGFCTITRMEKKYGSKWTFSPYSMMRARFFSSLPSQVT